MLFICTEVAMLTAICQDIAEYRATHVGNKLVTTAKAEVSQLKGAVGFVHADSLRLKVVSVRCYKYENHGKLINSEFKENNLMK